MHELSIVSSGIKFKVIPALKTNYLTACQIHHPSESLAVEPVTFVK